tara:strand:+ start:117 stop:734 length:618 start_codon:yes stop_codon:yes gene_type:complete
MLTGVTARYPRLNNTYRFDSGDNRSIKCDPFDEGAAYEMSFVMSDDTAKELHTLCMEAYKNASALDTKRKWPDKPTLLPYKRDEGGVVVGKCKLKGSYGGEKTHPPKQVDAARNKLPDDFMLTNDSKCNVAVVIVPFNSGSINGVSLRLRAVQVLELAEMQGSDDPFSSVSGGYTASATPPADDPFGLPAAAPAPANDLDDEIPF